jgi:hypothetical protein
MQPSATIYRPNDFLTVVFDGKPLTIRTSDSTFDQAVDAFVKQDWDALYTIINPALGIAKLTAKFDDIEVRDNAVFYKGEDVHGVIVERILQFRDQGADMTPLVKFLAKLMLNPSKRAVDELYKFLEHKNLPVTENGNFLAYKGVTSDYWSISRGRVKLLKGRANDSGQIFNGVGEEIQIPRNQVDDNKENHCSYGLHAGSLEYADGFRGSGKLMIVEIDPADVVSIPSDCNCQKLRTCRYKVVGEFEGELTQAYYQSNFRTENDDLVDDQFDSRYTDDMDEPMVDGGVYIVEGSLYRWDSTSSTFIGLEDETDTLDSDYTDGASFVDDSSRVDSDGNDLEDGELYRDEDGDIYRWNATLDQFESVRPNDGSTVSYLQSVLMDMEVVY